MSQLAYTVARSGDTTVYVNFKPYHVNSGAPNYERVMEILKSDKSQDDKVELLLTALDIKKAVAENLGDFIQIVDNELFYKGTFVKNTLSERIVDFFHKGFPVGNLVRFFERLQSNPSVKAQNELFNFLEKNGLHITDDGYFLGYKGVRNDYMDKYRGVFDNHVGKTCSMPRGEVDPNTNSHCSTGLHVGTFSYANSYKGYDGKLVLVKVDPADCVSVPNDGNEKLRTCCYVVIADVTGQNPLTDTFVKEAEVSQIPTAKVAKAVETPKTEDKPKTEGMPQRDKFGRFLPKNGGMPTVASGSPVLPKRDDKGRFLPNPNKKKS